MKNEKEERKKNKTKTESQWQPERSYRKTVEQTYLGKRKSDDKTDDQKKKK